MASELKPQAAPSTNGLFRTAKGGPRPLKQKEIDRARAYVRGVLVDVFKQHPTEEQIDAVAWKVVVACRWHV